VKRALTVAAAVAALLSAAPAAQAAPSPDKELCKSGGFANYVDPTTDLPFKNQGRCVSYVNSGGILIPVEEEPPVPIVPTAAFTLGAFTDGLYEVAVELQGQPNTRYDITLKYPNFESDGFIDARSLVTNADGLATISIGVLPDSGVSFKYPGQPVYTSGIRTPAAPAEDEPPAPVITGSYTYYVLEDPSKCGFRLTVTGIEPWVTYPLSATWTENGLRGGRSFTSATSSSDAWDIASNADKGTPIVISFGDQTFADTVAC
jgi:hypothetical protein